LAFILITVFLPRFCSSVATIVAAEEQNAEAYLPFGFWYKGYPKPTDLQKKVSLAFILTKVFLPRFCSSVATIVTAEEQNDEAYQPFGFWYKGYPKPTDLQKKVNLAFTSILIKVFLP
jgi:hypothetical protein